MKLITPQKKQIDWEAVQADYQAGQLSIRTIAHKFEISHTLVQRKAKKLSWYRDKTQEIRNKTKAALHCFQNGVSKSVSTLTPEQVEKAVQTNRESR